MSVAVPNTNPVQMVPPDIGFRSMLIYTEPGGTQALYVGGCSSLAINPGVPGGRLLRSTDGVNFAPVPQDPGTFLGNLGNVCFRGTQSYNGNFVAMAVDWKGQGSVIQSPTPWLGDNTFFQITSPLNPAYEICVFNNLLYVTFVNRSSGFSVGYTNEQGTAPYNYTIVLPDGGYKQVPNPIALSMSVYDGYLYVGGDGVQNNVPLSEQGAELFRIHTDNTWDLVQGQPRSTPIGQVNPISGLNVGFSWFLNQHMWRQATFDGRLYVGTFDESVWLRDTTQGASYEDEFGFDLWWTQDGAYFSEVDQQGFEDPFNMGVRSLQPTPNGMFLGTANPFYGLNVYVGLPNTPDVVSSSATLTSKAQPSAPEHLQVEGAAEGVLLSWDAPAGGASQYHIFRRTYQEISTSVVGVSSQGPAYTHSKWQEIGVTSGLTYADTTAALLGQYAYQVKAENTDGALSEYSNFVTYPSAAPPVLFSDVESSLNKLAKSNKLNAGVGDSLSKTLADAQVDAAHGSFTKLNALLASVSGNAGALLTNAKDADELKLMLTRLTKRAQLVQAGHLAADALGAKTVVTTSTPGPNQLNCTGSPAVCVQPTVGPEGTGYTNASVTVNGPYWANNRTFDNDYEYYIYEPGTPTPATAPVILFLHGYAAFTPANYQAWIYQMVQKGFVVVWVQYQASATSTFADFPSNAQAAWTDALYRLQNYTWEKHVRPTLKNGVPQTLVVGHSFGGWITGWIAGEATSAVPSYPTPLALVMIAPASLGLLPAINFAGISPATKMVIVSGDQDTVACTADAINIYNSTTQVPAAQKNYLFYNSDTTGTPNQTGDHYYSNTDGYKDTAAIDNRDFYVAWKLSVSAAQCVTVGTNCDVFLGNGSANQLGLGGWTNGTPIKPMSFFTNTALVPTPTGCAPPASSAGKQQ
jgi:hypothetical protein